MRRPERSSTSCDISDPRRFDAWLEAGAASSVNALRAFAAGIRQDDKAVRSALELPGSNAQTEGQVTRPKFIKRMMYGHANFDLLRQRVLLAAQPRLMRESRFSGAALNLDRRYAALGLPQRERESHLGVSLPLHLSPLPRV